MHVQLYAFVASSGELSITVRLRPPVKKQQQEQQEHQQQQLVLLYFQSGKVHANNGSHFLAPITSQHVSYLV